MSYARFGADDSHVYVFMSVNGWLECCACSLQDSYPTPFKAFSTEAMVDHLLEHIDGGEVVPDGVIPNLRADDAENFQQTAP